MLFVIIGHDGPDGAALRPKVRPAHLENLRPLDRAGKLKSRGRSPTAAAALSLWIWKARRKRSRLRIAILT